MTEIIQSKSMSEFITGVDELLAKRQYFIKHVMPLLVEGKDFYVIDGKKSLGKSGAELICGIYGYTAQFSRDEETIKTFSDIKGLICLECDLFDKDGQCVAEARGASTLEKCDGDINKVVKMAEKSCYISAAIRASGLSDVFTQDLEDMPLSAVKNNGSKPEDRVEINDPEPDIEGRDRPATYTGFEMPMYATTRQKTFLKTLIEDKCSPTAKEEYLSQLNAPYLSKFQCSELISSLLPS